MSRLQKSPLFAFAILSLGLVCGSAWSETSNPPPTTPAPKKIEVQKLRQDYWEGGEKAESEVVQNRTYSKAKTFELNLLGGVVFSDPFLSTNLVGVRLAYNFTDMWAVHILGWKDLVSESDAAKAFAQTAGYAVSTNRQKGFYGLGVDFTPVYGKLSIFGSYIWHYDLGFNLGGGVTVTDTGNDFTPYIGLSQKIYITQHISIGLDYRLMIYGEQVPVHDPTAPMLSRTNWSNVINLNLGFYY